MASRGEVAAVFTAAVVQGIVLVAFPAISSIFTSPAHYGFSTAEYGCIFVPQAIVAILASLFGTVLSRKVGAKGIFLIGLTADLFSMGLLLASQFAVGNHIFAYVLVLMATACLGIGFGFVVPSINTFTAQLFPHKIDRMVLTLNALLGLGTALSPIFAMIFVGFGIWWGLPLLMSALILALLVFSLSVPFKVPSREASPQKNQASIPFKIPARFWLYASFALVYGICETMNANWATVFISKGLGASATMASVGLTAFWGTVTGGRILFALIEKYCPSRVTFCLLPILLAAFFLALALTPKSYPELAVMAFGMAGLGCSALLPLVISFAQKELAEITASVAGGMIGFYQMGYGLAAFGVGSLQDSLKLPFSVIYAGAIPCALALAVIAWFIAANAEKVPSE